jgi:hypothetical protein
MSDDRLRAAKDSADELIGHLSEDVVCLRAALEQIDHASRTGATAWRMGDVAREALEAHKPRYIETEWHSAEWQDQPKIPLEPDKPRYNEQP